LIIQRPDDGNLFSWEDDPVKIEAMIPSGYVSNHASSLVELNNGDILCAWFAGLSEGSGDIRIVGSRLKKEGSQWEKCQILSDEDNHSLQNPFFFQSPGGALYLYHTSQQSRGIMTAEEWKEKVNRGEAQGSFTMQETALIYHLESHDNGYTWESKSVFSDKAGSFCRHPIQVLSNGDWIFPMYYSLPSEIPGRQYGNDYSVILISSDNGITWTEYPIPQSRGRVQMSVIEISAGRCIAFFRSRAADRIYKSLSTDYGKSWSAPVATCLPNNNASIHSVKLRSGNIAVVYNNYSAGTDPNVTLWPGLRYNISAAISEDEGETFPWIRDIEAGSGFHGEKNFNLNKSYEYPFLLQSRDGNIHIVYSYSNYSGRRHCIKYTRVTEDWIKSGS
jgi:predicted neuraminidase